MGPALSEYQRLCFGRKSRCGKEHGKEEGPPGKGKAACPDALGVLSHILLLTVLKKDLQIAQRSANPSLCEPDANASTAQFPRSLRSFHQHHGAVTKPEMLARTSFHSRKCPPIGRGLGALTSGLHCGLCCGMTGF